MTGEPTGVVAPSQRAAVLVATSSMTVIAVIDQTIANTGLPTIAHDIHASAAASIWVINAYQLALTIGIVPLAAAGDILGYWRVYRVGLIVFILASIACVFSHSLVELSVARFIQGCAGAALSVTGPPINRITFPPEMLGRAVGFGAMAVALGAAAGPVVGGLVLSIASWQWLFALNIPVGVAYVLAVRSIPKTPGTLRPYDWSSALMSIGTFGLALLGFDAFGHSGASPVAIAETLAAIVVGTAFIRRQLALPLPMFAVDLFERAPFTLAVFACFASFVAQIIAYVALPFAFQTVMGYSVLQVGLLMLPYLLATAIVSPFAGGLADRYNSSRLAAVGLTIFGIGLVCATLMGPHPAPLDIVWRMALCGLGYGLFQSPNNRSIQGSVPRERSGASQAIQAVARLVGQTSGAVLVAAVFAMYGRNGGSGITPAAVVMTMAIATLAAFAGAIASVWRGVLTGMIRFGVTR